MSPVSPDRIMKLGYAYREAKALLSAVELGVFTALSDGSLDPNTLTSKISIDPRGARDFFDALVAIGMLERDETGRYSNTRETALYLDRNKRTYLGGELEFINTHLFQRWNALTTALIAGGPPNPERAADHYPSRYADPAALEAFTSAMTAATLPVASAIARQFPWADYDTIVDVGSAQGGLLVAVARIHKHLTGRGFDLPSMKRAFDSYVQAHRLADRIRFHAGDFLRDNLPRASVVVMGRVLHNWDLTTKTMLLKKAHEALPEGGALVIYERLIDDGRRVNSTALLSSLNMLLMTAGGFDFTGADCIGWMREIGFRDPRVEPLTADQSMIVGLK
jgi:hypothetical protein